MLSHTPSSNCTDTRLPYQTLFRTAVLQAQKMDAIGKLTGGVADDFNKLLAVIVGSLDLARHRLATGADVSRYIDNAMTAAERGATLTQRMLAFARKQELKPQSVDCAIGRASCRERVCQYV